MSGRWSAHLLASFWAAVRGLWGKMKRYIKGRIKKEVKIKGKRLKGCMILGKADL